MELPHYVRKFDRPVGDEYPCLSVPDSFLRSVDLTCEPDWYVARLAIRAQSTWNQFRQQTIFDKRCLHERYALNAPFINKDGQLRPAAIKQLRKFFVGDTIPDAHEHLIFEKLAEGRLLSGANYFYDESIEMKGRFPSMYQDLCKNLLFRLSLKFDADREQLAEKLRKRKEFRQKCLREDEEAGNIVTNRDSGGESSQWSEDNLNEDEEFQKRRERRSRLWETRFERSPSFNISADAKGMDRLVKIELADGTETEICLVSTKWVFRNQQYLVDAAVQEGVKDGRKLEEFIAARPLPKIEILGKARLSNGKPGSTYVNVGTLSPDGSVDLDDEFRPVLAIMYLMENHGVPGLGKLGKECHTCLACGSQLTLDKSRVRGYGPECAKQFAALEGTVVTPNYHGPSESLLKNAPYEAAVRELRVMTPEQYQKLNISSVDVSFDTLNRNVLVRAAMDTDHTRIPNDTYTLPLWIVGGVLANLVIDLDGNLTSDIEREALAVPVHPFSLTFLDTFAQWLKEESSFHVWCNQLVMQKAAVQKMHPLQALMHLCGDTHFLELPVLEAHLHELFRRHLARQTPTSMSSLFNSSVTAPIERVTRVISREEWEAALRSIEVRRKTVAVQLKGKKKFIGTVEGKINRGRTASDGEVNYFDGEAISSDGGPVIPLTGNEADKSGSANEVIVILDSDDEMKPATDDNTKSLEVSSQSVLQPAPSSGSLPKQRPQKRSKSGEEVSIGEFKRARLAGGKVEVWNVDSHGQKTGQKIGLQIAEVKQLYHAFP